MADYKPGEMNIEEQEKTFAKFVDIVKWAVIIIFAALIFLYIING